MSALSSAIVVASEAAGEGSSVSPYVFGVAAFVLLGVLLVLTLMLKVGD